MAVEIKREGWLQLFTQMRSPSGFLSRRFTIKPGAIYSGDKVAIDIQRFGEASQRRSVGPVPQAAGQGLGLLLPRRRGIVQPVERLDDTHQLLWVDPQGARGDDRAGHSYVIWSAAGGSNFPRQSIGRHLRGRAHGHHGIEGIVVESRAGGEIRLQRLLVDALACRDLQHAGG